MKNLEQQSIYFVFLVKERFANEPSKFNEFANTLRDLVRAKNCEEDQARLFSKLKNMFAYDHQDLLSGLNHFVAKQYEAPVMNTNHDDPPKKKICMRKYSPFLLNSPSEFFNKISERCMEKKDYEFSVLMRFSEVIVKYDEKKINANQVDLVCRDLFKNDPDLYMEFTRVMSKIFEDEKSKDQMKNGNKWSLEEETMFLKEVCLYEMDLTIERMKSVTEKLEKNSDRLQESFTVLDVKCIEGLYNDSDFGKEIVEILQTDPVRCIKARVVVGGRLRQKKMQLEEQKLDMVKTWKEIFQDIREKGDVYRHIDFLIKLKRRSKAN